MSTGRDLLWQEMLRVWLRLDEAKRRKVLEEARRIRDRSAEASLAGPGRNTVI